MTDEPEDQGLMAISLRWPISPGPAVFANNIVLQTDVSGFVYINFFQANPPLFMGDEEWVREKAAEVKEIEAVPVARIAITKDKAQQFLEVLQKHLSRQHDSNTSAD